MEVAMDWELFSFEFQLNQMDIFHELIDIEAYKRAAVNLDRSSHEKSQHFVG